MSGCDVRTPRGGPTTWGELAEWEAGTTVSDTTAAQEWPEYNR
jgi:hypothetical protein